MTRDEIFEEIKALAIAYTELKPDKIVPDARLLRDLHLDGDDAAGFMAAFINKFDVDMSGFYWLRYFGDEGWDYLAPAMIAVARVHPGFDQRWRAALAEEREIALDHLVDVVEAKRWIHPGPQAARAPTAGLIRTIIGWVMAAPVLVFGAFGVILLYGLATGALGDISLVTAATAVAMTAFPLLLAWTAWRNIQRKLASAAG